jgi:hypothetical protein
MLEIGCCANRWLAFGASAEARQGSMGIGGGDRREQRADLRRQRALPFQTPQACRTAGDVRGDGSLLYGRQGIVQVGA